jgi:ethanolamine utilization protein EutQ
MNKQLLKVGASEIQLSPVIDFPLWLGSNMAEIFGEKTGTKMGAGMHEIFKKEVTYNMTSDDILYILKGSVELEVDGQKEVFNAGDFAYMFNGTKINLIVSEYVKLLFVAYPATWKD